MLIGSVAVPTVLAGAIAWGTARGVRMPDSVRSTFIATSFFGNLTYIGIPVLAHSLGQVALGEAPELLATAVIVMTAMTVINNALAVAVFQGGKFHPLSLTHHVFANPMALAGCLGILYGMIGFEITPAFDQVLESLGNIAVPLALLCIGGALEMTPLRGHYPWIATTSILKILALPVIGWLICATLGLSPADTRVVLIFCACPTAVVAYTMATQINADQSLATGAIAVSTVLSFVSLGLVLAVT